MTVRALRRLLGSRKSLFPLETGSLPIVDMDDPPVLCFSSRRGPGIDLSPNVKKGDEVQPGQPLASDGDGMALPSPVRGTVTAVAGAPDIRGGRQARAILVQPSVGGTLFCFEPLDPENAGPEAIAARIREAGLTTGSVDPRPLADVLAPPDGAPVDTVAVVAVDREPAVSASLQLYRDRTDQVVAATRLAGRLAGARRTVLVVHEDMAPEAGRLCDGRGVEILALPAEYPESLEARIARRIGGATAVIALGTALDALDAVRDGKVPSTKVLTLIGSDRRPAANYRVRLGTPLKDILSHAGLEPGERDKVVAGGPMRGFAQYTLDGAVDAGVDAVVHVPAPAVVDWSDEPCINCGGCIDACPVNLQVQLIGRYAEFGLFDRTVELEIDRCFECGLCASVCTARRPLLQLIRLARHELASAGEEESAEAEA